MQQNPASKKISISSKPSYFFRVFPKRDVVSFASDSHNYMLDLNTQKTLSVPGIYDPVPLGEAIMSTPDKKQGMEFYSIAEIEAGKSNPQMLYQSSEMKGVYQSTGLMEKTADYEVYGIIAAGPTDTQFQKIKVSFKPGLKVEPLDEVHPICKGWDIKLPMLSKNGLEISGFDATAGVSKIWSIDHKSGQCIEVDNLGVFAAKADFSFDSKKLVFHLSANGYTYKLKTNGSGEIDWLANPTSEMSQSVFQYDRATKTMNRISFNDPGSNAYYPVYQEDGSVLYAVVEASGASRFELVRPEQMKSNNKIQLVSEASQMKMLSIMVIGKFWNLACSPEIPIKTPEALALTALSLSQKSCQDVIHHQWSEKNISVVRDAEVIQNPGSRITFRKDLLGLVEKRDLMSICDHLGTGI